MRLRILLSALALAGLALPAQASAPPDAAAGLGELHSGPFLVCGNLAVTLAIRESAAVLAYGGGHDPTAFICGGYYAFDVSGTAASGWTFDSGCIEGTIDPAVFVSSMRFYDSCENLTFSAVLIWG